MKKKNLIYSLKKWLAKLRNVEITEVEENTLTSLIEGISDESSSGSSLPQGIEDWQSHFEDIGFIQFEQLAGRVFNFTVYCKDCVFESCVSIEIDEETTVSETVVEEFDMDPKYKQLAYIYGPSAQKFVFDYFENLRITQCNQKTDLEVPQWLIFLRYPTTEEVNQ